MGHYLSDMESDSEHDYRVRYRPMLDRLRQFREEQARGLMHTPEWLEKMESYHAELEGAGYSI